MKKLNVYLQILVVVILSALLKIFLSELESENTFLEITYIVIMLSLGGFIIYNVARFLEDITAILKEKTGLAGGLIQAIGTAFPDMILGIMAALLSLRVTSSNPALSIQYAIIAASTTFGSNIYNIGHAAWCIYRQNVANKLGKTVKMFPIIGGGEVQPLKNHEVKPTFFGN